MLQAPSLRWKTLNMYTKAKPWASLYTASLTLEDVEYVHESHGPPHGLQLDGVPDVPNLAGVTPTSGRVRTCLDVWYFCELYYYRKKRHKT